MITSSTLASMIAPNQERFDAAERCYNQLFNTNEVVVLDEYELEDANRDALYAFINLKTGGREDVCDAELEDIIEQFVSPYKLGDTLVCLVNYKGEGEKLVPMAEALKLPKFVSKSHSFNMFGA